MKQEAQFAAKLLSAAEYVRALHEPQDQVAVLLRNRRRGQALQRIASAETIAGPDFQHWPADQNRSGSDVFVGMNPLKDGSWQYDGWSPVRSAAAQLRVGFLRYATLAAAGNDLVWVNGISGSGVI